MEKPVIAKVAGVITLIQLAMSIIIGFVGGFSEENTGEVNGGSVTLILILITVVIMITASIFLIRGNKYGRILYLIGTIMTLLGNIIVAGIGCGVQSSLIPLIFTILLYVRKSAREYYKEIK